MEKFAVLETGGKQYIVKEGDKLKVEKLEGEENSKISFNSILLVAHGENVKVGFPYLEGTKVEAKILKTKKDEKKIVFKYHSKTRYRKLKGHRQYYTEILVEKISF
jgi:large subunit ribosomal protein L21